MAVLSINRHVLAQVTFDSAAFGGLCSVIHQFPEPGGWQGAVTLNKRVVAGFILIIDAQSENAQVDIDVAELAAPGARSGHRALPEFRVKPKGYAVFHASSGPAGYAVTLAPLDPRQTSAARYDTAHLQPGDFFVVSVLRPGQYVAKIPGERAEAAIEVVPLKTREGHPFRAGEPARVTANKDSFDPKQAKLNATEGLIFLAKGADRITMELARPEAGEGRPKPRWTNPKLIWKQRGPAGAARPKR